MENTFVLKQERKAARSAEVASVFVEIAAHISHSAGVVVGSSFHHDSDAIGAVAFIDDFLVVGVIFVGCFLDCSFHSVLRHVFSLCILHQGSKARVGVGVGTTCLCSNGDFLAEFGEYTGHIAPSF